MKYYMLSSNFLNSEEMQKLDINHRLEGRGAIMFIFEYLVDRRNGLGSYISIPSLARAMGKNKKFLLEIINNYGLFCSPKDTDIFYSPYLRSTLGLPEHPSDDEIKECVGGWKSTKKANESCKKNQKSSNKVATFSKKVAKITPQLVENQHPHYIEHKDRNRDKENIDKDKRYSSSTTTNIKSNDVNANVGSSSDSIKKSFADADWVKSISGVTALDLTDKTVADACIEWFGMQCKAKGKTFDTDENARWYFCNLLQQGRKTREAFDEYYKQYKYDEMVRKTAMECCEDDYYDYKENGRRYDSHHQIIPPDAPRQIDPNTIWSWIKLEFIPVGDFKMDPEMAARSDYYDEYRRIHNMK
ncbi:hypothetical protein prwr041_03430 [Prevotella herbatica]|uniref:Lin1244/Lin1753-like N-terminal domain-containing protein n=1 Tax=Prevotella herbatica TaxID=2801997 RepID=A0ABM7NVQ8_9BACT|nr:hypothetical protein [Prevotella herbatica]BCS84450.1 hypothetical protein prwr041_03430 [Prevotella herbatica]